MCTYIDLNYFNAYTDVRSQLELEPYLKKNEYILLINNFSIFNQPLKNNYLNVCITKLIIELPFDDFLIS